MLLDIDYKLKRLVNPAGFWLRSRLRLTRKNYAFKPAGELSGATSEQAARIRSLQQEYGIRLEDTLDPPTVLAAYFVLDLLHNAPFYSWPPDSGKRLTDIGSRNFYYARVLDTFFKPKEVIGVELDSYRLYPDFHTRYSHAKSFIRDLPHFRYIVADYADVSEPTDGILLLFPFLTAEPLLDFHLPMKYLQPRALFARIAKNLQPGGWVFISNHDEEELAGAKHFAREAGLVYEEEAIYRESLVNPEAEIFLSLWRRP